MLKQQREFWKSLRWYQKALVIKSMVPSLLVFKMYLKTLIMVVRLMVLV
jgi:hypothetical protein